MGLVRVGARLPLPIPDRYPAQYRGLPLPLAHPRHPRVRGRWVVKGKWEWRWEGARVGVGTLKGVCVVRLLV